MLFPLASIGELQFRLLLIRPDFQPDAGRTIEVFHRFDTVIGESRTSIEERRPGRRGLLLTQTCTLCLRGTGADDWRKGLAALGPRPVGIPLWIDAMPKEQWASRIYDAEYVVNFHPDTGAFVILSKAEVAATMATLAHPYLAPLLIGRWKERPSAGAVNDSLGYVTVKLAEASPWSCRIRPHIQAGGWTAMPDFAPSVKDTSDYGLELIQLAAAREPGLDRTKAAARWSQESRFTFPDRLAIRQALTHFEAMQGSLLTWSPVPAWFQPGVDTEATPDQYTARFSADTFTLSFLSGAVARSTLAFLQEVSTPTRQQSLPGEFFLYELKYQHDPDHPELLTNCDQPITATDGTFEPTQVDHQEIRRSLKPQDDKATITLAYRAGSFAADWLLGRLYGWVVLTIWSCDPDAPATRTMLYQGFVSSVRPTGNSLSIDASLFGRLLRERAPSDVFGNQCSTWVFSPRCGLDEAAWRTLGTSTRADLAEDSKRIAVRTAAGAGGPDYPAGYFAGGIFRTGSGRQTQIASIVWSAMVDGVLEVKTARPLWPDMISAAGQAVTLVPGCGRQYVADCGDKFANQPKFRGHPFMPAYLETRDSAMKTRK